MKKIKIVLTAIVMLFTVCAFALEPVTVAPAVKAAFEKSFSKAKEVSWDKAEDFYFASFRLNNVNVGAAYNEAGELVGTSRKIQTKELPLSISLAIAEKDAGYAVDKAATEITYEGSTWYYVSVKGKTQLIKLKASASGELAVQTKTKG